MSMQYLQGATIDYKEDFEGSNFVIQNPNAETTCGCGSSFSVWNRLVILLNSMLINNGIIAI